MNIGGIIRPKKSDSDSNSSGSSHRTVRAPEERQKRGRWVLPIILVLTVLVSMWFWF